MRNASSAWTGGDPASELVFEVQSRTHDSKDFDDNLKLYAALGIPEYIVVDSGEFSDVPACGSSAWTTR